MTYDNGIRTSASPEPQSQTRGYRDRHTETSRTDRSSTRNPRDMARDIQAAPETVDDAIFRKKTERRKRRVIADARVAVLDRKLALVVIHGGQR